MENKTAFIVVILQGPRAFHVRRFGVLNTINGMMRSHHLTEYGALEARDDAEFARAQLLTRESVIRARCR